MNQVIRTETVKKLDLEPGDILHIRVGMDLGDGRAPWVPTWDDLENVRALWAEVLPQDVKLVCTTCGVDDTIVRRLSIDVAHWPPRTR